MTWIQNIEKHPLKGMLVKIIENPAIVCMAKDCGMDFLFYDMEHGVFSYRKLHDLMLFGNAIQIPSIVRVAQCARKDISQILDYGASGVMVPMIETKAQAEQLVAYSKYPPIGKRSYSGGANTFYGPGGNHARHMAEINENTLSIVQIETCLGVANIDEILSVDGIDAVIVGPCDLGISMHHPDNVMAKEELIMIQKVIDACHSHHKYFGIIGGVALLQYFKKDIDFFLSAIDTNMIRNAMMQAVNTYEDMIGDLK